MSADSKELVEKALKILKDKHVGDNILKLIDIYGFESEDIVLDSNAPYPGGIEVQPKIKKSYLFKFGKDSLQIIIANLRRSYAPDDDDSYGDVFVFVKNECVLDNSINEIPEEWGSRYFISFSNGSFKKLKLGSWIDHLSFLVKRIAEIEKERNRLQTEKNLKKTAAMIDFGDYDPNK